MRRTLKTLVVGAVLGVVGLGVVFVTGMRSKSPRVLRAVRRMNRAFWNPRQMQTAGTPGAYASVVRHVGRRSGHAYATPIVAVPAGDGFVVALPYGTQADWVRNVLAAGSAELVHEGRSYEIERAEVVPMDAVAEHFSPQDQRAHRLVGVDQCLQLWSSGGAEGAGAAGQA